MNTSKYLDQWLKSWGMDTDRSQKFRFEKEALILFSEYHNTKLIEEITNLKKQLKSLKL